MSRISGLSKLAADLDRAVKAAPREYEKLQHKVADRYFSLLLQHAPADEEGRLLSSLNRVPYEGDKEWVEEYNGSDVEVGTKVDYAPLINDGYVTGLKAGSGDVAGAGFVKGTHFFEAALKDFQPELNKMAGDFLANLLKGVNR